MASIALGLIAPRGRCTTLRGRCTGVAWAKHGAAWALHDAARRRARLGVVGADLEEGQGLIEVA